MTKVAIFDTETTGLLLPKQVPLNKQPKIIELGVIVVDASTASVVSEHNWLINPGEEITAEITKITGIKNEDLVGKPSFGQLLGEIEGVFGQCRVGIAHNSPFDVGMLENELTRIGRTNFPWPEQIICSMQEYTPMMGRRPTLKALYERVMGKPLAQTHRANDDARAVHEILAMDGFYNTLSL